MGRLAPRCHLAPLGCRGQARVRLAAGQSRPPRTEAGVWASLPHWGKATGTSFRADRLELFTKGREDSVTRPVLHPIKSRGCPL